MSETFCPQANSSSSRDRSHEGFPETFVRLQLVSLWVSADAVFQGLFMEVELYMWVILSVNTRDEGIETLMVCECQTGPAARKSHWQADQRVYECFRKAFKWWRPSEAVHSLMIGVCEHLSCQWNHIRPINAVSAVRDVYRCDLSPCGSLSSNCIRGWSEASIYLKDCELLNIRQQPTRPFNKTQRCSWRLFSRAGWKI